MLRHNTAIQEGVLRDIVELLSDNVNGFIDQDDTNSFIGKLLNNRPGTGKYFRSISKVTSNLVLTFPMIVDNSVSIETASMVSKAVEKKLVLLLQMLFSAISVTNNKDAFDFVSKIHRNITSDDVLSYINKMDSMPYRESVSLNYDEINKDLVRIMKEDTKVLSYDLRPALEAERLSNRAIARKEEIEREKARRTSAPKVDVSWNNDTRQNDVIMSQDYYNELKEQIREREKEKSRILAQKASLRTQRNVDKHKIKELEAKLKENQKKLDDANNNLKRAQTHTNDLQKKRIEEERKNKANASSQQYHIDTKLDQPEIKKANEMVPSIMIVRFRSGDSNEAVGEAVIGVKVKLVYVTQADMIERIILKTGDQNRLFEFLKATTGEISMFKDFMFALDRAKLDIFSRSAKSSPIWKLLERRANVSRTNSFFNNSNGSGTAIATLLVSQDTMDILKKDYNFNSRNTHKLLNIMTDYSAMGFIITNDVTEKVQMLFDDNDLSFETLSYSSLEREDKNQYKKVINLLAGK